MWGERLLLRWGALVCEGREADSAIVAREFNMGVIMAISS